MDFDWQAKAQEQGIDLSRFGSETRAGFILHSIDDEAKLQSISTARSYVLDYYQHAGPVYKFDKKGEPTEVAIAVIKPGLDQFGNYAKKQHTAQFLTNWYKCAGEPSVRLLLEMWIEAFGKVKYRPGQMPEFDRITLQAIANQERKANVRS